MNKLFIWQAKNEKVLYMSNSNFLREFLGKFLVFFIVLILLLIGSYLVWWYVFLLLVPVILWLIYEFYIWKKNILIITNKRILKFVKPSLFNSYIKELKLLQVTEVIGTSKGILNKILTTGNVKFVWKDKEGVVWFKNVKYPKEIALYVSRLKDFIAENPNMDVKPFIPRKERYLDSN